MFVLLVSPAKSVREACLNQLEKIWNWLQDAEQRALSDAKVAKLVHELEWPRWVWPREVLIMLAEFSFAHVPVDVTRCVMDFATGLLHTEMNESAFNTLREHERLSPSSILGCASAWTALQRSSLASDHDRPAAKVTEAAKQQAAKLPPQLPSQLFAGDVNDFSIRGMPCLEDLASGSYVSPSSGRWAMIPFCLQASLALPWPQLEDTWMTLLMDAGSIAVHKSEAKVAYLVCWVCKWGAIMWPLVQRPVGSQLTFTPRLPTTEQPIPWKIVHVTSLTDWRMVPCRARPPCHLPHAEEAARGVFITMQDKLTKPLLNHAAQTCFANCQVTHLKALIHKCQLDFAEDKIPRTEPELCKALLEHLLPEGTEKPARVSEILAGRFKPDAVESILQEDGGVCEAEGLIHETDKAAFDTVMKLGKAMFASTPAASSSQVAPPAAQQPSSSSSTCTAASTRKKQQLVGSLTPASAKEYLPVAPGCTVNKDTVRHHRWQVEYMAKPSPPYSVSKSFGRNGTAADDRQAFLHCLRKVWQWHTDVTGEGCPWDLSS